MKIYFSCDTTTRGYPIHFIDPSGNRQVDTTVDSLDPGSACDEFEVAHPGAVYLAWNAFCARLALIAHEKEKLALWNQGEGHKTNTWGTSWE